MSARPACSPRRVIVSMAARKPLSSRAWQASYSARVMADAAPAEDIGASASAAAVKQAIPGRTWRRAGLNWRSRLRPSRCPRVGGSYIWGWPREMLKLEQSTKSRANCGRTLNFCPHWTHAGLGGPLQATSCVGEVPRAMDRPISGEEGEPMNWLLVAIVGYVLAQFAIGTWVSRRMASEADYILAGRRLGVTLVTFSVFATYFGAEAIVASGGAVYESGLSGALVDPLGYAAAIIIVGVFFARALWSRGLTTFAEDR